MSELDDLTQRLAKLEKEAEEIKTAIMKAAGKALGAANIPAPPRPAAVEGTCTYKVLTRIPAEAIPTNHEFQALFDVVCREHPKFAPQPRNGETVEEARKWQMPAFENAFHALQLMGRAEKPDSKKYASYWSEHAAELLAYNQIPLHPDMHRCFLPALFAVGNVQYTDYKNGWIALGLSQWGTYHGDRTAWRQVLESGKTLSPIFQERDRVYPTSQSQLIVGGLRQW